MIPKSRSRWQKVRKPLVVAASIASFAGILALIAFGYRLSWTGFLTKTLWDWLQLLIIPAVLAIGGYLFNLATSRNEQKNTTDNQREVALQEYIDKMSQLLLKENLRASQPEDEVRNVARAHTLTVLSRLDGRRKGVSSYSCMRLVL